MAEAKRVAKGTTKQPVYSYQGNLVSIAWEGGGEVPKALSGLYTSKHDAAEAVEEYMTKRRTPKNAKTDAGTK